MVCSCLAYTFDKGRFEAFHRMQLLHKGAMVNHLSVSRQGSTADGTTPLHACAVMKFKGQVPGDHYLESARILMLSGGNPYQENASGQILPIPLQYD